MSSGACGAAPCVIPRRTWLLLCGRESLWPLQACLGAQPRSKIRAFRQPNHHVRSRLRGPPPTTDISTTVQLPRRALPIRPNFASLCSVSQSWPPKCEIPRAGPTTLAGATMGIGCWRSHVCCAAALQGRLLIQQQALGVPANASSANSPPANRSGLCVATALPNLRFVPSHPAAMPPPGTQHP